MKPNTPLPPSDSSQQLLPRQKQGQTPSLSPSRRKKRKRGKGYSSRFPFSNPNKRNEIKESDIFFASGRLDPVPARRAIGIRRHRALEQDIRQAAAHGNRRAELETGAAQLPSGPASIPLPSLANPPPVALPPRCAAIPP